MSKFVLKLYVAGHTSRSERAIANLERICAEELSGQCAIEVIDVLEHPQRAEEERIVATPTLIKVMPLPLRRIIGDLSDKEKVLTGLDLLPTLTKVAV